MLRADALVFCKMSLAASPARPGEFRNCVPIHFCYTESTYCGVKWSSLMIHTNGCNVEPRDCGDGMARHCFLPDRAFS